MQAVYRLRKNNQFDHVYRRGKSVACQFFVLFFVPSKNEKLKVGFSVSKKIGKSVVRNLIKRRLKEAFRREIPLMQQRFHFVVLARSAAAEASYAQLQSALKRLLKKANLYSKEQ
ncbi:MAG: ribonuclease P protein component [Clostridia bacterium]|nr:ribonuclease P protein component [Clostridia bacterium]